MLSLLKQQDDLKALIVEVNVLKGNKEYEVTDKFDMDAKPVEIPNAPQLDNWHTYSY